MLRRRVRSSIPAMMSAEIESAHAPPRCAICGEVIGVYEPLVHVSDETVCRTSRAAEPDVGTRPGRVFHDACYEPAVAGS